MSKLKALLYDSTDSLSTRTVRLRSLRPLFHREVLREDFPAYLVSTRFNSPVQVFEMFRDLIDESREIFIALHLDGKNRIICFDRVSVGSLNQTIVHPRELFKSALLSSAAALVLVHNHPSGDPTPSGEDLQISRRVKEAGDLLGINILDHIIIGDQRYISFVQEGML